MLRRLLWLGIVISGSLVVGSVGPWLGRSGGPALLGLVGFVALTFFWWFTMRFLLAGRIRWRELFPSAIATGFCWIGWRSSSRSSFLTM